MTGISGFLSRALGLGGYHAASGQMGNRASSSESASPAVQGADEAGSWYETQLELLARLKPELMPGRSIDECEAIFKKLGSDVQRWICQLLGAKPDDQLFLSYKNRATLHEKMEDLVLNVERSRVPSLEERTQVVAACTLVPAGVAALISKYAMERFDGEMFGPQQWIDCWGATPVAFTNTLAELQRLVNQRLISVTERENPAGQMDAIECASFLGDDRLYTEEHPEPSEDLYECLNSRVRPQDKLLAGFSCAVTYIPQYVRKDGRILPVTARTLALDLGPNPVKGEAAKLNDFAFGTLSKEDANRTESSCYFVMERNLAPHTRGHLSSDLIRVISQQGDKGWELAEPRNFIAIVFSRRAWKGEFLYGENPRRTQTHGQATSRAGRCLVFGGFDEDGLHITESHVDGSESDGASGSRKFLA